MSTNTVFHINDLLVFDDPTLAAVLKDKSFSFTPELLGRGLHGADPLLIERITQAFSNTDRTPFLKALAANLPDDVVQASRDKILDSLFWELTYWKTPELYEELTEGEKLHPGIFENLHPYIKNKIVLDAGAGSGRASFECLRHQPERIYAIERSLGLLHILEEKINKNKVTKWIKPLQGRFDSLPLAKNSVDTTVACSAFTSEAEQGGEKGLKELGRVTKPGGMIIIIMPNPKDVGWFQSHGFMYKSLPTGHEMQIRFRSLSRALQIVGRFYKKNIAAMKYLKRSKKPEIPSSVLGVKPTNDYCWLEV